MLNDLNGWQRLFALFAVLTCGLALALYASSYPEKRGDGLEPVYDCSLTDSLVSPARAQAYLRLGHIPESDNHNYPEGPEPIDGDCAAALQPIANGTAYRDRAKRWWGGLWDGVWWAAAFLAVIYTTGVALGWVWRGFFPKRSA